MRESNSIQQGTTSKNLHVFGVKGSPKYKSYKIIELQQTRKLGGGRGVGDGGWVGGLGVGAIIVEKQNELKILSKSYKRLARSLQNQMHLPKAFITVISPF